MSGECWTLLDLSRQEVKRLKAENQALRERLEALGPQLRDPNHAVSVALVHAVFRSADCTVGEFRRAATLLFGEQALANALAEIQAVRHG